MYEKNIQKGKKVFISSTSYDLIDLRAELLNSLPDWGFKILAHEKPDFPCNPGLHSHDVCLEAVSNCDIFLLIIDKRYGGEYAGNNIEYTGKNWSITRCEADVAFKKNKEQWTYVRDTVWNERKTYNDYVRGGNPSEAFKGHVEDIEVFEFLNEIQGRRRDNWMIPFKDSVELKNLLGGRLPGEIANIFSSGYFKVFENGN